MLNTSNIILELDNEHQELADKDQFNILLDQENNKTVLLAEKPGYINPPPTNSFIFFSKDNVVNVSALKGYYGEMTFVNNSNEPAELYAVSCEVTESSK